MAGNETEAQLRLLQLAFAVRAAGIDATGGAGLDRLVDVLPPDFAPGQPRFGYAFAVSTRPGGFTVVARPEVPQETGIRGFCIDATGHRAQSVDASAPVGPDGGCSR